MEETSIEDLSNQELRVQLLHYGISPGPITDTTRNVYQKKLKRVRESDDYQTPGQSPKRKKVESTPSLSTPSEQVRRRSVSSPRLSRPRTRTSSPKPSAPPHPSLAAPPAAPSPLHAHHAAASSSSIDDSSVTIDSSSSFAPVHPKLACSQSDLESVTKIKRGEPSGLDLASVFSSTVQSGLQFIGDSVKKLVNPILNAASPNSPTKNLGQRRNVAARASLFRGNYQPSPFRGNQSFSRGPPSSVVRKTPVSQPPSSRINQSPSSQPSPSRIHQSPSRINKLPSSQGNRPPSSFAQFNSIEIGGEFDDETDCDSPAPSAPPPPPQHDYKYDWELAPADVQICLRSDGTRWRLGKGGFGEVFKGLKDGVDEVAVKVIHLQSQENISLFKSEIDLISKLRHRHIVQFYGACIKPPCLYMVTELMHADLFSAIKKDIRYHWSGIFGHQVAEGIVSGLHYLHSRKPTIVHRDIKSPNILLMDGMAKIADVGVARTKGPSDMTAQRGFTIAWAAPEVVYRRRATEKIDIWSFGIILWEIYTGRPPGPGQLVLPATASVNLKNLYSACTSEDPARRPTAAQILLSLKDMV